jgi:hypothetical protein
MGDLDGISRGPKHGVSINLLVGRSRWFTWTLGRHLHLHVLSNDLRSEKLKHKKHYNSFHPNLGFFLHLHDVLSWFDEEPSYFQKVCTRR